MQLFRIIDKETGNEDIQAPPPPLGLAQASNSPVWISPKEATL